MSIETLGFDHHPSPTGTIVAVFDAEARLRALDWTDYDTRMRKLLQRQFRSGYQLRQQTMPRTLRIPLERYFAGEITAIDTIEAHADGTAFQREVWQALRTIPAGGTLSYAALAARIGRPQAVRAVGLANGANPIAIVVPCHRVIGTNGSLTGYGGGLARKRWLLAHEGVRQG